MAIFENKVITRYTADTSQEISAIEGLIRKNTQLKEAEKQAAAERERHFDELVLGISRAQRAEEDRGQVVFDTADAQKKSTQEIIGLYGKMAGAAGLAIAAIGAVESVLSGWRDLEDKLTRTTNTALKFADGQRDVNQVMDEQVSLAHRLRQPLEQTMGLYDGIRDGLEGLNYSHSEQIKLAEQLGKAAILEGKGIESAGEFIKRLSVTMDAGADAGKLLKNLMLEMPDVANVWVEKFGGSKKALLDAVDKGKVGFDDLVTSLIDGNTKTDESFAKRKRTNKEWRDEFIEAQERAKTSGMDGIDALKHGMDQANGALENNRKTTVEWAEDVVAKMARISEKAHETFEKNLVESIDKSIDAIQRLGVGMAGLVERFGKKGAAGMFDPWASDISRDDLLGYIEMPDDNMSGSVQALQEKRKAKAQEKAKKERDRIGRVSKDRTDRLVSDLESTLGRDTNWTPASSLEDVAPGLEQAMADLRLAMNGMSAGSASTADSRYAESATRRNESKLEEMFGPLEEFNAYATAFGMLSGAVTSAMDAWIDGSMSAGEAVKKFIGQALKALASQMAVEALKHGAYAIGSLAFGDVRGAGQHAAAAAAFGVGAGAAAAAARSMGGGADVPRAGSGAGSSAGGGSGGSYAGPQQQGTGERVIVVLGDSFGQSSPRMQQMAAERTVDLAFGATGVTSR